MARFGVEFRVTRFYSHEMVIEADSDAEARMLATMLVGSRKGDRLIVDSAEYEYHEAVVDDVWDLGLNGDSLEVTLDSEEIWNLIEGK